MTPRELETSGRVFPTPRFGTEDGRAVLHCRTIPQLEGRSDDELRLMTVRSEGQFETIVYEEEDPYRNQTRRDVILMHPDDLRRLGLKHDRTVRVENEVGKMDAIVARGYSDLRPGNALMYYPESNVLVPRYADPQSKTPAFKGVVVRVVPC